MFDSTAENGLNLGCLIILAFQNNCCENHIFYPLFFVGFIL